MNLTLIYFLFFVPLLLAPTFLPAQASAKEDSAESVQMTLSKKYSPQSLWPAIDDYVLYEVYLKNIGDAKIMNERLLVNFVSDNGKTNVHTSFSIPDLEPGETTTLYLGPFKMRESGQYSLFLWVNSNADPTIQNNIKIIGLDPPKPSDSFNLIDTSFIVPAIASSSLLAGLALLIIYKTRNNSQRKRQPRII